MATIRDVARSAGVGVATVSRVLNDSPKVSRETRAAVLAVIAELGFVPNASARNLVRGRTNTIGVVVPFLTRPGVVERVRGIEAVVAATGGSMVMYNVESVGRRESLLRNLPEQGHDGLIIVSLPLPPDAARRLLELGPPTVLLDTHHRSFSRVVSNDIVGGRLAADHLIDLGHRRVGFVGDEPRSRLGFSSSRMRCTGIRLALIERGLAWDPTLVGFGEHGQGPAAELATILLRLPRPPSAIVAASDTQAIGVMSAARAMGIAVPDELSVIGYDDIELAAPLGLSTVRQGLTETGRLAVDLLRQISDDGLARPIRVEAPLELIARSSTAIAPPGR